MDPCNRCGKQYGPPEPGPWWYVGALKLCNSCFQIVYPNGVAAGPAVTFTPVAI